MLFVKWLYIILIITEYDISIDVFALPCYYETMKLRNINLNLLVVLDALLNERHVTRAGEKIHLSQSAMSNSLKQLREIFGDDLLVRGQSGQMMLTKKAHQLRTPVNIALNKVASVFEPERFDPKLCESKFTIGMTDYTATILLPTLIQKINKHAPLLQLIIKPISDINHESLLESGELDLAIGSFKSTAANFMVQRLYSDELVCVADKSHPALSSSKPLTMKQFLDYPHLLVSFKDDPTLDFSEIIIAKLGKHRNIPVVLPYSLVALALLKNTLFICILPMKFTNVLKFKASFATSKVPFTIPMIQINQSWHRRINSEPAHQWLRQTIKSCC